MKRNITTFSNTFSYKVLSFLTTFSIILILDFSSAFGYSSNERLAVPIHIEDTIRKFDNKRVIALTDTSKKTTDEQSKELYEKLKKKFYRHEFTQKIFDLIFTQPNQSRRAKVIDSKARLEAYNGHPIGSISLKQLPLFGPSVTDTSRITSSWLGKAGNAVHSNTKPWVIRKNLLFEKGDKLNAVELADTERILRRLPFIRDARIYITPRESSDSVDILVLTQDVFPVSLNPRFSGFDKSSLLFNNFNVLGTGHNLKSELIYDASLAPALGFGLTYTIPNINGTFINGSATYYNTDTRNQMGIRIERLFYTPDIKWAGGIEASRNRIERAFHYLDYRNDTIYDYSFAYLNGWIGHAFNFGNIIHDEITRSRFIATVRVSRINYLDRPASTSTSDIQPLFQNYKSLFGSFGWTSRRYFRDSYIYGFGRTEDVPYGKTFNIIGGIEDGEGGIRHYLGIDLARGNYYQNFGYLYTQLRLGSYFNAGTMEQRLAGLRLQYYSKPIKSEGFLLRQFATIDYLIGDRRLPHEFLMIRSDNIRGINTLEGRGTQRLTLKLETVVFSPFGFLGFQVAGFAFADIGFLETERDFILNNKPYHGYGIGIRARNETLVFKIFQFRIAYYPHLPHAIDKFGINLSPIPSLQMDDFQVGEPGPIPFY